MRIINYKNKWILGISLILIQAVLIPSVTNSVKAAMQEGGDDIIASGDGFALTQEDVAAFQNLIDSANVRVPKSEVVRTALKYELLSREYKKEEKGANYSGDSDERAVSAEEKMRNGNIYIQKVLMNYVVPEAVIESYYRSHPEKYSLGKAPDGKYNLIPLDDQIKDDIRFAIVAYKKEVIVQKFVDGLIAKYHIKINNLK